MMCVARFPNMACVCVFNAESNFAFLWFEFIISVIEGTRYLMYHWDCLHVSSVLRNPAALG